MHKRTKDCLRALCHAAKLRPAIYGIPRLANHTRPRQDELGAPLLLFLISQAQLPADAAQLESNWPSGGLLLSRRSIGGTKCERHFRALSVD